MICKKCKKDFYMRGVALSFCEMCGDSVISPHIPCYRLCEKCSSTTGFCQQCLATTLKITSGDLLDVEEGVIIHQVNNKHVMGAGIARSIREKYNRHYYDYMNSSLELGDLVCTRVSNKLGIIGMVSQDGFGRNKDIKYTNEEYFKECLYKIKDLYEKNTNVKYYMPYKIGCGLGNGSWEEISKLISEICPFVIIIKK